jgi:hypothetical protein
MLRDIAGDVKYDIINDIGIGGGESFADPERSLSIFSRTSYDAPCSIRLILSEEF